MDAFDNEIERGFSLSHPDGEKLEGSIMKSSGNVNISRYKNGDDVPCERVTLRHNEIGHVFLLLKSANK